MISVLLVEDSPIALNILQRLLAYSPDINVVGTATNGKEALDLLPKLKPDVVCTDMHMPVMGGLALVRAIMQSNPIPILVISISVELNSPNVFFLLDAGAVDVYPKPQAILEADQEWLAKDLAKKIRLVAGVKVIRRNYTKLKPSLPPIISSVTLSASKRIIAIGASTGGPNALHAILVNLPANFPTPIICVQHIGEGFLSEMVKWLDSVIDLSVCEATQGQYPQASVVYFAPDNVHLGLDNYGRFNFSHELPHDSHRPSVTVMLQSVARYCGASTIAVLLTGMGRDGADGMAEIAKAGGVTIAQDEASCIVYGMPKAAVELSVVQHILPLEKIAPALIQLTENGNNRWSALP